jgi:hypothetical protein
MKEKLYTTINIVRGMSNLSASSNEGNTTFKIPNGLSYEDFFIAAFVQNTLVQYLFHTFI